MDHALTRAGCDLIRKKTPTFCCKVATKICAEKIGFTNALLELYISGREGPMHLHLLPALAKWESWMFYLLSAEQAWLHFLQAALTSLRAAF